MGSCNLEANRSGASSTHRAATERPGPAADAACEEHELEGGRAARRQRTNSDGEGGGLPSCAAGERAAATLSYNTIRERAATQQEQRQTGASLGRQCEFGTPGTVEESGVLSCCAIPPNSESEFDSGAVSLAAHGVGTPAAVERISEARRQRRRRQSKFSASTKGPAAG